MQPCTTLGQLAGRLLAPQRVGQLLRRERVTRSDQQGGEHDPVTRAEGRVPLDLRRPEKPYPHDAECESPAKGRQRG